MGEAEYRRLKKQSRSAGLSANAWLMQKLEQNRPILYRVERFRALRKEGFSRAG